MTTIRKFLLLLLALCSLLMVFATKAVMAVEIRVSRSDPACVQPTCYSSIQQAIDYVDGIVNGPTTTTVTYSVRVESGTYNEAITLRSDFRVQGRETTKTILNSTGTGAVVTVNTGVERASFSNFTISTAALGISVLTNAQVEITNNIFNVGSSGRALTIEAAPSVRITNNVFYQNGTAIRSNNENIEIANNIFSNNGTDLENVTVASFPLAVFNDFFPNPPNPVIVTSSTNTNIDPKFVDAARRDFHLSGSPLSPCIDQGQDSTSYNDPNFYPAIRNDMGAYGGPGTDTIPSMVSGVTTSVLPLSTTISLNWNENKSYLTSGYRVHYGKQPGAQSGGYNGTGATEGPSPVLVSTGTAATLSSLPVSTIAPPTPVLNKPQPLNQSLDLSWSAISEATMYRIYYSTSPFTDSSLPGTYADAFTNSLRLSGLINGQTYYIAVKAIAQNIYYIAVTAVVSSATISFVPGIQLESAYSEEKTVPLGTPFESSISPLEQGLPELLVPYPVLPNGNQGCFIATAAYGNYSSPEVKILREFRDRYLLTSEPGSAFVRWYYQHSPAAAAFLNAHPGYKPLVRAAITPAVGAALFMTRTSLPLKMGLLMITGCVIVFLFTRKRFSSPGGDR